MTLVMTGGGDSDYFSELDATFFSLLSNKPSLLFIPIAGEPETYNDSLERIQTVFSTIKFDRIEACTDLGSLSWEYLHGFDAIYIDGGNTFRLMDAIRNSKFYELTKRFMHHGGIINGDSAGAIVLGSHIGTAHFGDEPDENICGLISYQGLSLLHNWAVHCHYVPKKDDEEVHAFVRDFGLPVIALAEETGIVIDNHSLRVIGEGDATLFIADEIVTVPPNLPKAVRIRS